MEKENNLTRLRKQRGLTQKEVAEELEVTRQAISQWESGKTFPSIEKQLALSQLYGVSVEELYGEKDAGPEPPVPERRRSLKKTAIWAVLAAYACFVAGTLVWGKLTNSTAVATGYLIWETFILIVILIVGRGLRAGDGAEAASEPEQKPKRGGYAAIFALVVAGYLCLAGALFAWGGLTNSPAVSMNYVLLETIALAVILFLIWKTGKK